MQKKVVKGVGPFYDIEFLFTPEDYSKSKEKALKEFQKDLNLPWFRKGFVPLNLVEEHIQPQYISLSIYEYLINKWLQEVVTQESSIRFIGEPYDIKQDKQWDDTVVSLKLDIFPEVIVKDSSWDKLSINKISPQATKEEIDEALLRLKKNYADYKDCDMISLQTISKISLSFLDKYWQEVDKWVLYVWEQEFQEFPIFEKTFVGKTKNEPFTIPYKKDLPPTLQPKKAELQPVTISLSVLDIKEMILPEINEGTLLKLFGKDSEVKNEQELLGYIEENITQQKFDTELIKQVEEFLKTIKNSYMEVSIPKTLLNQEVSVRLENLEKRFGGKDKMEAYLKQMWDEKSKSFVDDISKAAEESLEKFLILQKIADVLQLDINWDKPADLEIEKKLYEKFVWSEKEEGEKKTKKTVKK